MPGQIRIVWGKFAMWASLDLGWLQCNCVGAAICEACVHLVIQLHALAMGQNQDVMRLSLGSLVLPLCRRNALFEGPLPIVELLHELEVFLVLATAVLSQIDAQTVAEVVHEVAVRELVIIKVVGPRCDRK